VTLAVIPLLGLIVHLGAAGEPVRLRIAAGVLMSVLTAVLAEGVLAASLWIPALWNVPGFNVVAFNRYWWDINVIQLNAACAQWDSELAYTLRPGTCTFSNPGYRNQYRINRLGVRDDGESLERPVIVAVGDSHTMGMGVEQQESYATQLERMTGLKTLNTGVSSYGTARELMLLDRVDRRETRYVLIQFCSNDFAENREFLASGTLPRRTREWFDARVENDRARRRYYAGKFIDLSLSTIRRGLERRVSTDSQQDVPGRSSKQFLEDLLKVIERHAVDLTATEVIVFEMDFLSDYRQENAAYLQQLLIDYQARARLRNVRVVDVMKDFGPELFIPLDGHMNALGHRRVAERLAAVIQR
jgi:lysophospholipase L1-like esterase